MITHVQIAGVYVSDQDRALDFYKNKLGFEVVSDIPFGAGTRWIEVAPPGAKTRLVLFTPKGMENRVGSFANIVFGTDDVQKTYEELRDRGVEFTEAPVTQPWGGTQAIFVDPDGNTFVLHS